MGKGFIVGTHSSLVFCEKDHMYYTPRVEQILGDGEVGRNAKMSPLLHHVLI